MEELPPGIEGDAGLVRVGLPLLREEPRGCPHGRSLRARPLVADPARVRRRPITDFALGPVMNVLDLVEHQKKEVTTALADRWATRNCHPSHRVWAEEAVTNYLTARTTEENARRAAGHPAAYPVREE